MHTNQTMDALEHCCFKWLGALSLGIRWSGGPKVGLAMVSLIIGASFAFYTNNMVPFLQRFYTSSKFPHNAQNIDTSTAIRGHNEVILVF
jgi:hypothetical protein